MLTRVAFIIETASIIICLYRIYGEKIRLNLRIMILILLAILIQESMTMLGINEFNIIILNVMYLIYSKISFKETWIKTGISIVLLGMVITICQFICALCTSIFIPHNETLKIICINVEVLCFGLFLLPKLKIDVYRKHTNLKNKVAVFVLAIVGGMVFLLILQGKLFHKIRADLFLLMIPAIIGLIFVFLKLSNSQMTVRQMEKERDNNKRMQISYDELLRNVRLRQHEFKNHMAAIFSTHYTYKTYEQLVRAQEEYCIKLTQENKYNNLLLIENNIIAGFLYNKFQEVEGDTIPLDYRISTKFEDISIPIYHLVEMMGILIDNAVEASKGLDERGIFVEGTEDEKACYFIIQNRYRYISYAEIEQWFQMNYSSKGENRGIGLFHIKSICVEWNCNVLCENVNIADNNWIKFTIEIPKADNQK